MKRHCLLFALIVAVCCTGCSQSWKDAKYAFDRGTKHSDDVSTALFVKGWGMNRALITESRSKWVKEAQLKMMRAKEAGLVTQEKVEEIINFLDSEIGKDEAVTSQNFAYLSYCLVQHERAQQMLGNVDFKLESDKPIFLSASEQARASAEDAKSEIDLWVPLIGSLSTSIPASMKTDTSRGTATTQQSSE